MPNVPGLPFSLETVAASSVLDNDGVQPSMVKWLPLPSNELVSALHTHRVDAILVTEPEIFAAEATQTLVRAANLQLCAGRPVGRAPESQDQGPALSLIHARAVAHGAVLSAVEQGEESVDLGAQDA